MVGEGVEVAWPMMRFGIGKSRCERAQECEMWCQVCIGIEQSFM